MKTGLLVCFCLVIVVGCQKASDRDKSLNSNVVIANEFIDAFYSFDKDSLQSKMRYAQASQPDIVYYQGWAECGNYEVIKRGNVFEKNDSLVICPVTVKDDLMAALQINFNVTDTFKIVFKGGQIRAVETSSNDLNIYYTAKEWVKNSRPEYVEKQCEGIWAGGPTPCECIKGMIKGFHDFKTLEGTLDLRDLN